MPVEIHPIIEDYINLSLICLLRDKRIKFNQKLQMFSLPLIAVLLVVLPRNINYTHLLVAILLSVIWIVISPIIFKKNLYLKLKKEFKSNFSQKYLEPYILDKYDKGLVAKKNNEIFKVDFELLDLYYPSDDAIYIIGEGLDFIIPKRDFKSDDEYNRVKDFIDFQIQVSMRK